MRIPNPSFLNLYLETTENKYAPASKKYQKPASGKRTIRNLLLVQSNIRLYFLYFKYFKYFKQTNSLKIHPGIIIGKPGPNSLSI
jgi:hypothetical protein